MEVQGADRQGTMNPTPLSKLTVKSRESLILRLLKWMMFCDPKDVDAVWATVARATARDELGITAKVEPCPMEGDPKKERLICVYTKDFQDRQDVGRVIQKMRELRLVETRGKILYYKPGMYKPPCHFPWAVC